MDGPFLRFRKEAGPLTTQGGFPLSSGGDPPSCPGCWKQSGMCFLNPLQTLIAYLPALDRSCAMSIGKGTAGASISSFH